ncbi:PREDICTED: serine/threonine-protein kinase 32A-like [Rhagoletis zephyria]|uniref:serine/threonine-protein kinase 32A-like n=1 Tax=Rhagoletis zephyria TaxID=28612 RepID=UPI0008117CD8|nr:PREDICTED: serine/threonine-protein kinase 32A-like [Rhagoletis zephyria]
MGANSSSRSDAHLLNDDDVNFDHFQILRAIGKGSFGKVSVEITFNIFTHAKSYRNVSLE